MISVKYVQDTREFVNVVVAVVVVDVGTARIEEEQQQKSQRSFKQPRANLVSKEMTPKWLLERDSTNNDDQNRSDNETTATDDTEHEKERAAFLQHLKERWGDDD